MDPGRTVLEDAADAVDVIMMAVGQQDIADGDADSGRLFDDGGHLPGRVHDGRLAALHVLYQVDEIFHRA